MKIVIADDEYLIRVSLRHNLEKLPIGMLHMYEAADGVELLRYLEVEQPDIAFVDIKMPLLGGLDAIEQGRTLSPHTKFIVLTGFAEFDYAQKAVALQIYAYLLKPVSYDQLWDVMHSILEQLSKDAAEYNQTFTSRIAGFITDMVVVENERFPLEHLTYKMIAVCHDGHDGNITHTGEEWLRRVKQIHDRRTNLHYYEAIMKPFSNVWVMIIAYEQDKEARMPTLASHVSEIKQISRDHDSKLKNKAATTLITTDALPIEQLISAYDELIQLAALRALLGISTDYTASFLSRLKQEKPYYGQISELLVALSRHHAERNDVEFGRAAELFCSLMEANGLHGHIRTVQSAARFLHDSLGIPSNPEVPYPRLKDELLLYSQRKLRSSATRNNLIQSVLLYVNLHYAHDISITGMANLFDITPNYLSALFHKKTGRKFVEYVTELRMREAQRLLIETDLSVQDITMKVGFYSMSHFGKVFAKYHQLSPMDYRKSIDPHLDS
ncbi:response regulator transcription factor [Paenibacillus agricola]|uniref:Helix-turn-helix domain-containing protein n=1 Tax=Paenibacillus agricola TaxID=2716264 RepID=A0ABX0JCF7_9BACL|nr:helix-turn-helix domain-containing protein [Paenibacillus agricola]NHN33638.1 helix-turn-helix domain-containing protein [Paenibacillus agricola]